MQPGETTDDTAMTLAVAEGILEDPDSPYQEIGKRFIDWYHTGPKDIGIACETSIRNAISNGEDWWGAANQTQGVQGRPVEGNGSLMRTIYPALYYTDEDKRRYVTRWIARMTHTGEQSTNICEEYVEAVHAAINGDMVHIRFIPGAEPTGYVVDSYNVAVEAIIQARSFEDALVKAVNRGGDADTIGAICGGLAGAMYGCSQIPRRWLAALDNTTKMRLDILAAQANQQHE